MDQTFNEISPVLYQNRFCHQDNFGIVICGGWSSITNSATTNVIEFRDFNTTIINLTPMLSPRFECYSCVIGSSVFVLSNRNYVITFDQLSSSGLWSNLHQIEQQNRI